MYDAIRPVYRFTPGTITSWFKFWKMPGNSQSSAVDISKIRDLKAKNVKYSNIVK